MAKNDSSSGTVGLVHEVLQVAAGDVLERGHDLPPLPDGRGVVRAACGDRSGRGRPSSDPTGVRGGTDFGLLPEPREPRRHGRRGGPGRIAGATGRGTVRHRRRPTPARHSGGRRARGARPAARGPRPTRPARSPPGRRAAADGRSPGGAGRDPRPGAARPRAARSRPGRRGRA